MSEEDKAVAKAAEKVQGFMYYLIVALNAMFDKALMLVLIFVLLIVGVAAAGLGFQLYNGTIISLDLIPINK